MISNQKFSTDDIRKRRDVSYEEIHSIDYLNEPIGSEEFYLRYLIGNKPCVLGEWATKCWTARQLWVDDKNNIDVNYLKHHFGNCSVPVADCNTNKFASHCKDTWIFREYLNYMEKLKQDEYPKSSPCLYLKDWHFTRDVPDYQAYKVPEFFASDWLNEHWQSLADNDDYRFVYIGPKGSWTPLHADVFRSYSWSANVVGCKKWLLFPPGEEENLKDVYGNLVFDLNSEKVDDESLFPNVKNVKKSFEVIQRSGEVLFVPSGWHHQVFNLEDTISINHNWFNGSSIDLIWRHLQDSLAEVKAEIADCDDMEGWPEQCQLMLKACVGMNYEQFGRLLLNVGLNRLNLLHSNSTSTSCDIDLSSSARDIDLGSSARDIDLSSLSGVPELMRYNQNSSDYQERDVTDEECKLSNKLDSSTKVDELDSSVVDAKLDNSVVELNLLSTNEHLCHHSARQSRSVVVHNDSGDDASKPTHMPYYLAASQSIMRFDLERISMMMQLLICDQDFNKVSENCKLKDDIESFLSNS